MKELLQEKGLLIDLDVTFGLSSKDLYKRIFLEFTGKIRNSMTTIFQYKCIAFDEIEGKYM